jgi:aminomethyltransferase
MGETTGELLKSTPLAAAHEKLGAQMGGFGGFSMPIQYTGILAEHRATREHVGLFDLSHMGEIEVTGSRALACLDGLLTNDPRRIGDGRAMYALLTNERGGALDDLIVYRFDAERFWLVVNAANAERDFAWVAAHAEGATVQNRSAQIALVAAQGPAAEAVVQSLAVEAISLRYMECLETELEATVPAVIARTGYTGEDGFEIYVAAEHAEWLWEGLIESGRWYGLHPIGLGARDTLRLEMAYPLYGHELDEETTPLEAGLGFAVKLKSRTFVGSKALADQRKAGARKRLVGFTMDRGAIPREGYSIFVDGEPVGRVTSGNVSPSTGRRIGLGYVPPVCAAPRTAIEIEIRGKRHPSSVVKTPFYDEQRLRRGP